MEEKEKTAAVLAALLVEPNVYNQNTTTNKSGFFKFDVCTYSQVKTSLGAKPFWVQLYI